MNNRSKYADGFYTSMIDNKDSHIPSPLIMVTCTMLRHPPLQWQKHKSVHLKPSKSKLKADRPDCSTHFNYKNQRGNNEFYCAAKSCKLLTSPGVADMYTFLMSTWNTLPVSYHQRLYKHTLPIFKRHIQQAENPTPSVVVSMEAACVENAILLDYLTSEVVLVEPEFSSTDRNILIDNNRTDNKLHLGMPGWSGYYEDEGDESDKHNAIPTASHP